MQLPLVPTACIVSSAVGIDGPGNRWSVTSDGHGAVQVTRGWFRFHHLAVGTT